MKRGKRMVYETVYRRNDGSELPVEVHSRLIRFDDTDCILSVARDITDRKKAEARQREIEEELVKRNQFIETILDNLPIGLAVSYIDEDKATYINKKLEEIYGWPKEALEDITTFFETVYPNPAYRKRIKDKILRDIQSGDPDKMTWDGIEITTSKGEKRIVSAKNIPLYEQNVMISTVQDVTESRKLQERLRQAQKMEAIGSLAGGIAHDFNNLLFPIIGMSEMLLEDLPEGGPEHESVQVILDSGKRGGDLVKQILAFSRQSEHKMIPVKIQQVMKEVLKLAHSTIPSDIELSHDLQPDCGLIMADPTQIHQIGMNLITNAYHAVESSGGRIYIQLKQIDIKSDNDNITLTKGDRYILLSVSDTGCGIEPTVMDKIFEPYFTTKLPGKGTGLGLAVVYGIVKEHRGDIKVYSEPGKGTTISVFLPMLKRSVDHSRIDVPENPEIGSEHILLVDDEKTIVQMEKRMLERLGYHVTECYTSLEGLEIFRKDPEAFDLVITDMTMPNMTGDILAKELFSIRKNIPIIICTGFSEKINREKADSLGIKGFLMKPVVKSEMAKTVRRVLDETLNPD